MLRSVKGKGELSAQKHPRVNVAKWVDFSSKYGVGYLMNEGTAGVFFNDGTKIVTQRGSRNFTYIDRKTTVFDFSDQLTEDIERKCHLLRNFRNYLTKKDKCLNSQLPDSEAQPVAQGSIFVRKWLKKGAATIFCFNNRSTQAYFKDKSEVFLDHQTHEVLFLTAEGELTAVPKDLAGENRELTRRLRFIKEALTKGTRPEG